MIPIYSTTVLYDTLAGVGAACYMQHIALATSLNFPLRVINNTVKDIYYQTSMINNVTFCASVMSLKDADITLLTNKQISIKGLSLCEQF